VEYGDLIKSGIGAVIGFFLAQLINLAKLIWEWWHKSKLAIEVLDRSLILSHTTQLSSGESAREENYAFNVRNVGGRIATSVRFQLLNIQFRQKGESDFANLSDIALNLSTYTGANFEHGSEEISLVPKSAATIALASWREDHDTVRPCAKEIFDYYDEMCQDAYEYKFEVVAFDASGDFVMKTITIIPNQP
jgi:hypothetical protein